MSNNIDILIGDYDDAKSNLAEATESGDDARIKEARAAYAKAEAAYCDAMGIANDPKPEPKDNAPTAATLALHGAFQDAFDFFNAELFEGELPDTLLTFAESEPGKRGTTMGFFIGESVPDSEVGKEIPQIAVTRGGLNRVPKEVLATFVHEMCHLQDFVENHPDIPKSGHGRKWEKMMLAVGLRPIFNNVARTSVHHEIIKNGPFETAFDKFANTAAFKRFGENIETDNLPPPPPPPKRRRNQPQAICPDCGQKARGPADMSLICGTCYDETRAIVRLELIVPVDDE